MKKHIYNFSAGPAIMPSEVLEKAQSELTSLGGMGMSVMEISHRSDTFEEILESAKQRIKRLLWIPDNYQILFLQGGASLQFSMIPQNFLNHEKTADYVITGAWGEKAYKEAAKIGKANIVFSGKENSFKNTPKKSELRFSRDAEYIHYCSNETIDGVEFKYDLEGENTPVVCDASSNILSKPIEVSKYALIYAGAQKNIGPSGVTLVIIRNDLLERIPANLPAMLDFSNFVDNHSMPNTPNTWGIYLINLVCEWLEIKGGLAKMAEQNEKKAGILYSAIDQSDGFYCGHAEREARSLMNVTFRLPNENLEKQFCNDAANLGFEGLKGHRSVGGVRASIYNAFPLEGIGKLVDFMRDFSDKNS